MHSILPRINSPTFPTSLQTKRPCRQSQPLKITPPHLSASISLSCIFLRIRGSSVYSEWKGCEIYKLASHRFSLLLVRIKSMFWTSVYLIPFHQRALFNQMPKNVTKPTRCISIPERCLSHKERKAFTVFVVSSLSSAVNISCLLISSTLIKDRVLIKYWNETASTYSWSPAQVAQKKEDSNFPAMVHVQKSSKWDYLKSASMKRKLS